MYIIRGNRGNIFLLHVLKKLEKTRLDCINLSGKEFSAMFKRYSSALEMAKTYVGCDGEKGTINEIGEKIEYYFSTILKATYEGSFRKLF